MYTPQESLYSKWIEPVKPSQIRPVSSQLEAASLPWGKTAADPGGISCKTNLAPFSARKPPLKDPFTAKLNSVARGCVCGVFMPQGPRKPIVIAMPFPTSAGIFSDDAATLCPAAPVDTPVVECKKSKTY